MTIMEPVPPLFPFGQQTLGPASGTSIGPGLGPALGLVRGFGRGTRLLTADGPTPVEDIEPGEAVLDPNGRPHFVLWQGSWDMRPEPGWAGDPRHPVVISANAFGPGKPRRDLYVTQQHRMIIHAGRPGVLVTAASLPPHLARIDLSARTISYHAVVTRSPCMVMAENLPCEGVASEERALADIATDQDIWAQPQAGQDPRVALRP